MTNRDLLKKILDSEKVIMQSVNQTLEQVSKRTSKKRPGYIKCVTDDKIAGELLDSTFDKDKGLVGFMIFVPKSEFKKICEEEK